MRKRTPEEAREYMRRYRAEKRGATHGSSSDAGVTAGDKTPVSETLDVSGAAALGLNVAATTTGPKLDAVMAQAKVRPSFLAAPDDDCAACGHDRHAYHLDGPCKAPALTKSKRCGCPDYVSAAEPF